VLLLVVILDAEKEFGMRLFMAFGAGLARVLPIAALLYTSLSWINSGKSRILRVTY
jgi:hypothetical protein